MYGGNPRDHNRKQLLWVALEMDELHESGLSDERLVEVGTHQTLDLPQDREMGTEGGLSLIERGRRGGEGGIGGKKDGEKRREGGSRVEEREKDMWEGVRIN